MSVSRLTTDAARLNQAFCSAIDGWSDWRPGTFSIEDESAVDIGGPRIPTRSA
jgi:hypothetical protein